MKHLIKNLIFGCIPILLVITACSEENDPPPPPSERVPRTDSMSLPSKYVFDNYSYPIKVYLPASYKTNKNLPIIYILDGALNFEIVKSKANNEAIIVGIGDFAFKEEWSRRFADFMPGKCPGAQGKHLDFYNFITRELVPNIDINYDNDHNSRSLIGHSAAGIFTFVSVFLEDPKNVLFHNFIAIDPGLGCDPDFFLGTLHDNNFSEGEKTFKFYLTTARSGTDVKKQIAEEIQAKEYKWLTYKYEEFPNEDHFSVVDPSLESGLSFIFEQ